MGEEIADQSGREAGRNRSKDLLKRIWRRKRRRWKRVDEIQGARKNDRKG